MRTVTGARRMGVTFIARMWVPKRALRRTTSVRRMRAKRTEWRPGDQAQWKPRKRAIGELTEGKVGKLVAPARNFRFRDRQLRDINATVLVDFQDLPSGSLGGIPARCTHVFCAHGRCGEKHDESGRYLQDNARSCLSKSSTVPLPKHMRQSPPCVLSWVGHLPPRFPAHNTD